MMQQARTQATQAVSDLTSRLKMLEQDVASAQPGFQGDAGRAFQLKYPELHADMQNILNNIQQMADIVGAGAAKHVSVEENSSIQINQVNGHVVASLTAAKPGA
jgi:WXG100 family type VII secretion target